MTFFYRPLSALPRFRLCTRDQKDLQQGGADPGRFRVPLVPGLGAEH